jgi:DNA-binding CsgD family transcriptional regulator
MVENGILNLSDWDFKKGGVIKITDGSPINLKPSYYDRGNDTAVFDITVILPQIKESSYNQNSLALMIPPLISPYNLWINGNIALSNDYNYISHWNVQYRDRSNILSLFNYKKSLKLHLKISNYSAIALIRDPILIGQEKDIRELRWWVLFREGIIEGALIIISIINILIWLRYRKNYSFFMVAFFSIFQALNMMGRGETLNFFSNIPVDILLKMQIILLFIKLSFLNLFFMIVFNNKPNRVIAGTISSVSIIAAISLLLPITFQPALMEFLLASYYISILATLLYYIFNSLIHLKTDREKSFVTLLSTSVFLISYIIYVIQYRIYFFSLSSIISGPQDTLSYGILFFVFTNTFYQYLRSSRKVEGNDQLQIDDMVLKYRISKRERDILILLIQRYSYKEISDKLFISNKTVETHIYHIYQKTGAKNKQELIKMIESIL